MERVGEASPSERHELSAKVDLWCSRTAARPPAALEGEGFEQLIKAL